eukprot:16384_1
MKTMSQREVLDYEGALNSDSVATKKRKRDNGKSIHINHHHVNEDAKRCVKTNYTPESEPAEIEQSNNNIQLIVPTIEGSSKAARIIRSNEEIVSIPTERYYSHFCNVKFQAPVRTSAMAVDTQHQSWDTFTHLIRSQEPNAAVFLHHPIQAYNFVSFSTPKKFIFKQRTFSDELSDDSGLVAVKFSESHEVLSRLTSAFWPGTVAIYAPVRSRKLKEKLEYSSLEGCESTASLVSLSSEVSDCDVKESPAFPSIPILPESILRNSSDLHIPSSEKEDNSLFVGLRCPSHPITRRILAGAYGQDKEIKHNRLNRAVVGIDAMDVNKGPNARMVSCKDVVESLSSFRHCNDDEKQTDNLRFNVMNGEEKRDVFCVPTCQFSTLSSVSLVIDTPRRTVILIRDESQMRKEKKKSVLPVLSTSSSSKFEIHADDVLRALNVPRNNEAGNVKTRAIATVMGKWDVVEKEV